MTLRWLSFNNTCLKAIINIYHPTLFYNKNIYKEIIFIHLVRRVFKFLETKIFMVKTFRYWKIIHSFMGRNFFVTESKNCANFVEP